MSPIEKEFKGLLQIFLNSCLLHLVETNRVTWVQLKHRAYISWDYAFVLRARGHGAATTQDDQGRAAVLLDPNLQLHQLVSTVLHEATHVAQLCRGDVSYPQGGGVIWKGERFKPLAFDNPAYFEQPWEAEAKATEPELFALLKVKYPQFEGVFESVED